MLITSRSLFLLLLLALLAGVSHADDFMLGAAAPGGVALAQSRQDCDIQPGSVNARVIYHDGQSAPVSVPMDSRGAVADTVSSTEAAVPESSGSNSGGAPVTLPSAEAVIPQKPRGGGLRWQSVLPGSIK
ncbi:hypothetical protein ACFJIW_01005 [Tahibacter sp. UC22_41]|uniref:hypothetical protein n=1 Tax=Tahibacter sp. UC22_41 TaxID=3350178 RepID=UPI002C166794|nr:hypothetical protein [Tahibacter sp.]